MAEAGRARPVIVASIATILTANMAVLSSDRANAERTHTPVYAMARVIAPSRYFVVFGKSDTRVGRPTIFAVRPSGVGLKPWSRGTVADPQPARSHDGSRAVAVHDGNLWMIQRDERPQPLTAFSAVDATYCGASATVEPEVRTPMWSPDDTQVAFVSNANHLRTFGATLDVLVVDVVTRSVHTAYASASEVCDGGIHRSEFVTLFGWAKSANMAA